MNPLHIALIGDSIFDNAAYVDGGRCVTDQLKTLLPDGARVTLVANDGDVVADMQGQLRAIPL